MQPQAKSSRPIAEQYWRLLSTPGCMEILIWKVAWEYQKSVGGLALCDGPGILWRIVHRVRSTDSASPMYHVSKSVNTWYPEYGESIRLERAWSKRFWWITLGSLTWSTRRGSGVTGVDRWESPLIKLFVIAVHTYARNIKDVEHGE